MDRGQLLHSITVNTHLFMVKYSEIDIQKFQYFDLSKISLLNFDFVDGGSGVTTTVVAVVGGAVITAIVAVVGGVVITRIVAVEKVVI